MAYSRIEPTTRDASETRAEELGALPRAPMAMPRQDLEHKQGIVARLRPVWDGWLRTHVLGN